MGELVTELGFDPLLIGSLADGVRLQPFAEAFGSKGDAASLQAIVDRFPQTERGAEVLAALAEELAGAAEFADQAELSDERV